MRGRSICVWLAFGSFLLLLNGVIVTESEKILVVFFFGTKSHKWAVSPLIEELGKRGHNVTVLSPFKPFKKVANVHEILTIDVESMKENFIGNPYQLKEERKQYNPFMNTAFFTKVCSETYDLPYVQQLRKEKFDLVLVLPLGNDCALGYVHKMKAPIVLFSPLSAPSFLSEEFGSYLPLSIFPNVLSGLPKEMNLFHRMKNVALEVVMRSVIKFIYLPAVQQVYQEKLGKETPSIHQILGNASLILSNSHVSLQGPKPWLPDIVEVGGLNNFPAKELPKDLEDFIEKGKGNGFILFSMGSAMRGDIMPERKRQIFLNVFKKVKQQVLWKWENESMAEKLPKNVKLSKWLPQQDLLGHRKIKMFITHCGGGSLEESVYHGVPIITLPMFADQPQNANLAKSHGISVNLEWNDLTEENLMAAIQEILNNSKYRDNVKGLSTIYKDQPDKPMDRAIYWIQYVMRHKGAPHLRSTGRNLNFIQFHLYDVILAYFLLAISIIFVASKVIKYLWNKVTNFAKKTSLFSKKKAKMN